MCRDVEVVNGFHIIIDGKDANRYPQIQINGTASTGKILRADTQQPHRYAFGPVCPDISSPSMRPMTPLRNRE